MIGDDGIYMLYRRFPKPDGSGEEKQLIGKFIIFQNNLRVLEDHDGTLGKVGDKLTEAFLLKMFMWSESPYWKLMNDQDIAEGNEDEEIPELKLVPDPWSSE